MRSKICMTLCAAAFLALVPMTLHAAATIVIVNSDAAGVGFNDPTPVAPVGENTGTTLGEQRLIAFQKAAEKWGQTLTSSVTIRIRSSWTALTCTASSAVLGSAGATEVFRDFTNAPTANRWYGKAEANALVGADLDSTTEDLNARFNINLGNSDCLAGTYFYLGLDGNHGTDIDLVTVLLHEFAHGLGFQTYTNGSTGAQLASYPSVWDDFLLDSQTGKVWSEMTDAERSASALKDGWLVWTGSNVAAAVPTVLQRGQPQLTVTAPAKVAGRYLVGTADFGPTLTATGVTAEVMPVFDTTGNKGLACNALSTLNRLAVNGKIAVVDRGTCTFTVKVKNAQDAGALGVIVVDNAAGSPPSGLGGADATITIPSVRITLADGTTLKAALATRSRTHSGVFATLGLNSAAYAGADAAARAWMYAPNPYQSGSSVSHWDTSAFPNLLMEPAINGDLTHEVTPPNDLTFPLLKDIGWN